MRLQSLLLMLPDSRRRRSQACSCVAGAPSAPGRRWSPTPRPPTRCACCQPRRYRQPGGRAWMTRPFARHSCTCTWALTQRVSDGAPSGAGLLKAPVMRDAAKAVRRAVCAPTSCTAHGLRCLPSCTHSNASGRPPLCILYSIVLLKCRPHVHSSHPTPSPTLPPPPPCPPAGLEDLELHHIVVNDWDLPGGVTAPQNVVLISIASGKLLGAGARAPAGRGRAGHRAVDGQPAANRQCTREGSRAPVLSGTAPVGKTHCW